MNNAQQYFLGGQYYPQQYINQFQTSAAEPVQLNTSQNNFISPQYSYPSNYYISTDAFQYIPSPEYPVDWGTYNASQYTPENIFYYKYPYMANESADADTKALEQSFNQFNLGQYTDASRIDYSRLQPASKQYMPASVNKWDVKRTHDPNRSTSSRYWKNSRPGGSQATHTEVPSQYNPQEFKHHVEDAKYFVIKSYSEEDIFRSIKHSVWCSTEMGNKRLNTAFQSKAENACIYLFFSVNGTGHFCGVALMTSSVDFSNSSDVWTQRKWKGQFSVQWLYVKDVPNSQLRSIILENNENKPVTNSRDTQEVPGKKGLQVLQVIHHFKHHSSIFDDFQQ